MQRSGAASGLTPGPLGGAAQALPDRASPMAVDAVADLVPVIDGLSRRAARRLGYRPRNRVLVVGDRRCYEHHVGRPAPRAAGELRGLCGPGPSGSALNVIWVAPAPLSELLETLTHEYSHAVLPRSVDHTGDWLAVHLAVLSAITSPAHAAHVRDRCLSQYGLG